MSTYSTTNDLVSGRFDDVEVYADDALTRVTDYIADLQALLASLTIPTTDDIDDVDLPDIDSIDYAALPSFSQVLSQFPSFSSVAPTSPGMNTIPDVNVTVPNKNFNFVSTSYQAPTLNYGTAPGSAPQLSTISCPAKPTTTMPTMPTLDDIIVGSPPTIDLGDFTAVAPEISSLQDPKEFKCDEAEYNSDIRVALFGKILYDIANGGTGLDVTVEEDIYDRGRERQRVENERLYQEVQNQFSATGFSLPPGSYAARMLSIGNEISRKNDQLSREIAINQADLAQKNTQFTTQQAVVLEQMLVNFFDSQQNRALSAQQAAASNAVDIYNAVTAYQKLSLEKYQTEAQVFELKIRAELNAVEIYRAEIEAVKAKSDVNQARVAVYNAQIEGLNTILKMYATEMESAKLQATIQQLEIEAFRLQTQAYATTVDAEKGKIDVFKSQIDSEKSKADVFATEVEAYKNEVSAKLAEIEVEKANAANVIRKNQEQIELFRSNIDKYRAEIDAEIRDAQLLVSGYQVETGAYSAQVGAKGMEFESRIKETQNKIELTRAKLEKAKSIVESTSQSYVALKQLEVEATSGVINANSQIAASAMGAVNATASQSHGYSDSSSTSTSDSFSETHTYNH